MHLKLETKIVGSILKDIEKEIRKTAKTVNKAVQKTGGQIKRDLQAQVIIAGLGRKLSKTWKHKHYRDKGYNAAGLIYSKAPGIIRTFDQGTLIRSRKGRWLAIPTKFAPKRGIGNKRITPMNFPEHRYGPLRFVYRKNRYSLLVVDGVNLTKSGQCRRPGHRSIGQTIVMFILVPQVRMSKRLDVKRVAKHWLGKFPEALSKHMKDR